MEKFKAIINVGLKPTIKDIKALTLKDAVSQLVDIENFNCKSSSTYAIEFDAKDRQDAENIAQKIAEDILSNSVIEEYSIKWETPYV